jgi:hypothetical protein
MNTAHLGGPVRWAGKLKAGRAQNAMKTGGKLCVLITIRNTNNASFSVRRRISLKEILTACPAVIGRGVQTIQAEVWTKKFRRSCAQTLNYNLFYDW